MTDPDGSPVEIPSPSGVAAVEAAWSPDGRRPRLSTGLLCLLVLSVQFLPTLPMYFRVAPTLAAGVLTAAAACIVTVAACWAIAARASRRGFLDAGAGWMMLIASVVVLITLHAFVAREIEAIAMGRFVASLLLLVLLLGAALALSTVIRAAAPSQIERVAWVSFWVLCAVIALKVTRLQPPNDYIKSTFPFTETSHFALAFGPMFLYRCARSRPHRRTLWVLAGFGLAAGLQSGALILIALLGAMITRRYLIIGVLAVAVALAAALAGLTGGLKYYAARADLSDSSGNLSALVYLQGWELLGQSLVDSDGWGLGFQQLGVQQTDVGASEEITRLTNGGELNQMDGSFEVSKLGCEFGAIGLLLVAAYCVLALRCLRALRAGRGPPAIQLARSVVLAFSVDMFVRGIGYFSPSSLLMITALLVLAPAGGLLRAGIGSRSRTLLVLR